MLPIAAASERNCTVACGVTGEEWQNMSVHACAFIYCVAIQSNQKRYLNQPLIQVMSGGITCIRKGWSKEFREEKKFKMQHHYTGCPKKVLL